MCQIVRSWDTKACLVFAIKMEINQSNEKLPGKKIRFLNVANEGDRFFSFVVCETNTTIVIPYAWLNNLSGTTHATIFNLAVEEFGFNEKYEPICGGVLDKKVCDLQPSIQFGGVDDQEIEKAVRHKAHCESS